MPTLLENINGTTFRARFSDLFEVELGDINTQAFFKPHMRFKRTHGNNSKEMSISLPDSQGLVTLDVPNNKIGFTVDNNSRIEFYPIEPNDEYPEGSMEMDWILSKRPTGQNSNQFRLRLDTTDFNFEKLLPLDQEYDQARCIEDFDPYPAPFTITPNEIRDANGEVMKSRSDREVNSYKGKAKKATDVAKDYGVNRNPESPYYGKTIRRHSIAQTHAHLKRGKMKDALGAEAWVEDISYDPITGDLLFTLPSDFLKNATYPIRQAIGVDPAYTEEMASVDQSTWGDVTWNYHDIYADLGVPYGAVAEVMLENQQKGSENQFGVRTYPSSLSRVVNLHEAEPDGGGAGDVHCRMFALTGAYSTQTATLVFYTEDVSDLQAYILGYWENVSFTEAWASGSATADGDNWIDYDALTGASTLTADTIYHIIASNAYEAALIVGVRTGGSSLSRSILLHEAESGGNSYIDFLAKTDGSGDIEVYDDSANTCLYYNAGYFSSELDFVEAWSDITPAYTNWTDVDLTSYLDQDGRIVDVTMVHNSVSIVRYFGVRNGDDSSTNRVLYEHEAEDNGSTTGELTGFSMSVQSNASGVIRTRCSSTADVYFFLAGYFKPTASGTDYPITLSVALDLSTSITRSVDWDRSVNSALDLTTTVVRTADWTKALSAGLNLATTIAVNKGKQIATSVALALSTSVIRTVDWTRGTSSPLALATTVVRTWAHNVATSSSLNFATTVARALGKTITTSSALSMATSVVKSFGRTITTSSNLTTATTVDRDVAYNRATSSGLTMLANVAIKRGWTVATSTALVLSTAVIRTVGWARATSVGMALATTVVRTVDWTRAVSSALSFSVTIVATPSTGSTDYPISLSVNISMGVNISRTVQWNRDVSVPINFATNILRAVGWTRSTSSGLNLATTIAKSVGRFIYTSSALSVATSVLKSRGVTVITNSALALGTTVVRTVAYNRAASSAINLAVNIVKSVGRTATVQTALALSTSVARVVSYNRATSSSLSFLANVVRTVAYNRATSTALSFLITIVATTTQFTAYLITTSVNLSMATSVTRTVAYARATSTNLTLLTNIVKSWGRSVALSVNLTMSPTVVRSVAYLKTVSTNLTLNPTVARTVAFGRAVSTALVFTPDIQRIVGWMVNTSVGMSLATTITKSFGKVISTSSALAMSTSVTRTVAWGRAVSTGLTMSTYSRYFLPWILKIWHWMKRDLTIESTMSRDLTITSVIKRDLSIINFPNQDLIITSTIRRDLMIESNVEVKGD